MYIYSYTESWYDIIQNLLNEISDRYLWYKISKLSSKIYKQLQYFKTNQIVDWYSVKHLENQIFEFKISIPNTKDLIRLLFAWERDELVLLTWYLIKPENYNKIHTRTEVNKYYHQQINDANTILQDYKSSKKLTYQLIDL